MTGDLDGAIELYHQALSRKPDDPFSSDMLNRALEEALSSVDIAGEEAGGNSFMSGSSDLLSPHQPRDKPSSFLSPDGMSTASSILRSGSSRHNGRRRDMSTSMATDDGSNLSFASGDVDMSMT